MKIKNIIAIICASLTAITIAGCATADNNQTNENEAGLTGQLTEGQNPVVENPQPEVQLPANPSEGEEQTAFNPSEVEKPAVPEPKEKTISYLKVTADNLNIRTGAGTNYSVAGTAQKSTLYANLGEENGWYKTSYKNKTVYISKKYCEVVEMKASENEKVEAVIAEGTKLLGTPYVYGAVRYHDGNGKVNKSFNVNEYDCSSLMQYIFYKGADELLQVNTRTQIYQGTTVFKSKLQRGDLIFFTNASRKNNTGIERVGHVALYLGDNYILHTASDFAKIEQISSTRWGYYIQSQRMI